MEELIGNNSRQFRPYSPPSSNLIDLVDSNRMVITQKLNQKVILDFTSKKSKKEEEQPETDDYEEDVLLEKDDGHVELEYDPLLDCYYDPKTNTYHSKQN